MKLTPDHFATCLGSLVIIGLVLWMARILIKKSMTPFQSLLYYVAKGITRLLWRGTADRQLPIEMGQGAVIVTNHGSSVDPFFVQLAVGPRIVRWMVAKEFVEHPAFRWFLTTAQAISTNRGGIDTAATKRAIRSAASGHLVGMLPEGRINRSKELLLPVRPGAAFIALRAGVPIIPCYIDGAPYRKMPYSPFFMTARVRVFVGDPIDVSSIQAHDNEYRNAKEIILQAMQAIAKLAEQPDFEPCLAGRNWKPTQAEIEKSMAESDGRKKSKRGNSEPSEESID